MDQQFGNNGILRVVVDVVLDEHLTTVYVSLLFNCLVLERALKMNVRNAADNCTFDLPLVEADVNGLVAEKHQAGRRRLRSAEGQQLEDSGSKQIDLLAAWGLDQAAQQLVVEEREGDFPEIVRTGVKPVDLLIKSTVFGQIFIISHVVVDILPGFLLRRIIHLLLGLLLAFVENKF